MAAVFAKLTVGRSGLGAAHASYITRMSALDPDRKAREGETPERDVTATLSEDLDERALGRDSQSVGEEPRGDDPIWTWNVPDYITGDGYGIGQIEGSNRPPKDVQVDERMPAEKIAAGPRRSEHRLTLKEKVENARAYFASREEFERAKGGRTHYRMVLSFDVKATNGQIKELTNKFLGQSFPKAMAFAAVHRDTEHPHVHIYIHSRQIDGRRIQLTNDQFRAIDEKWSKIYSEFAGDRSIHIEHLRKKEETREWKRAAALAYRKGEPIPPKPERDNDRRERLAEQRLSAQRSEGRDRGVDPGSRPEAEPVMRPKSERETARLIAKEHIAREALAHLVRTDSPGKEIVSSARTAQGLKAALEKTIQARRQVGKDRLPAPAYTIEEGKRLIGFKQSREVVRDDRAAARLVAQQKMAEAEMRHVQVKAEGFELRRHLWKFDVEGWEGKISLKDLEQQIHSRQAERLEVLNFIRPSKREMIQGQIVYLREVKADIQKQLSGMRELIVRDLRTAQLRHEVASDQVELARGQRAVMGRGMPGPLYTSQELARLAEIANTDKDAGLLRHVHEVTKAQIPADRERAGVMVGRSLAARLEMLKAHDRMREAREYELVRHVAVRDEKGSDHSGSVREIKPRTLAEVIENRLMRPSEERAALNEQAREMAREQVRHSEREFVKARDYFEARRQIAEDYSRAAGLKLEQVTPVLNREQVEEMRGYVASGRLDRQVTQKREFEQAIPLAEEGLKEREARQAAKEYQAEQRVPGQQREPSMPNQQELDRARPAREDYSRGR